MQTVIESSEQIAEQMSDLYFKKLGAQEVNLSLPGAGKSGQFDRVYKNSDGSWSVVECKGGESPLKGRQGADGYNQQGTKAYIQSIIDNLNASGKLTLDQKRLLRELQDALDNPQGPLVTSYVFRQSFDEAGNLRPAKLSTVQFWHEK